ncbi:hypothetical protein L226DRAFT_529956 [Lentinus tigrinus ALCF2SS1-7]|uniref:Chromatin modification-related protein n=1 Tax=Lentinus tigrinus ALCF2SS1-6 TaxID=1328759 RepID=A0A5C2SPP8_9APHY|nr:hypothetical protein L227DRAFT_569765 [Lentinus tigrinus ALCF2SS1-6]RPD79753.1 hypothetical protein L226DRAFT_529956 [Lentinus tigrinus ALCF2SS1-7]
MSTRRHKRRRIDEEVDSADEDQFVSPSSPAYEPEVATTAADPEPCPEAPTGEPGNIEAFPKEQEIWDVFKEEQYEVLEQLPLSLHRAFTLIHELDEQAQDHIQNLTPAILKYVSLRRSLAEVNKKPDGPSAGEAVHNGEAAQVPVDAPESSADVEPQTSHLNGNGNGKLSIGSVGSSLSPPPTSTPGPASTRSRTTPAPSRSLATLVKDSDSTRDLLVGIAQSAEEVSRASNEKYYLARHVYDLIDRYIRDLDRAIKEQEASISLGLRPGTHPASIILPEVVMPKPTRNRPPSPPPIDILPEPEVQPATAPVPAPEPTIQPAEAPVPATKEPTPPPAASPTEDEIIDITEDTEPAETEAAEPGALVTASTHGRRRGRKRRRLTRPSKASSAAAPGADENSPEKSAEPEEEKPQTERQPQAQPPLTLKIPAQNVAPPLPEGEVPDPNEPRYCFCNQVSYGEMIACDNPTCEREWFHLGCVGLTRAPKGKWYCRDCAESVKRPKGKKRAR